MFDAFIILLISLNHCHTTQTNIEVGLCIYMYVYGLVCSVLCDVRPFVCLSLFVDLCSCMLYIFLYMYIDRQLAELKCILLVLLFVCYMQRSFIAASADVVYSAAFVSCTTFVRVLVSRCTFYNKHKYQVKNNSRKQNRSWRRQRREREMKTKQKTSTTTCYNNKNKYTIQFLHVYLCVFVEYFCSNNSSNNNNLILYYPSSMQLTAMQLQYNDNIQRTCRHKQLWTFVCFLVVVVVVLQGEWNERTLSVAAMLGEVGGRTASIGDIMDGAG